MTERRSQSKCLRQSKNNGKVRPGCVFHPHFKQYHNEHTPVNIHIAHHRYTDDIIPFKDFIHNLSHNRARVYELLEKAKHIDQGLEAALKATLETLDSVYSLKDVIPKWGELVSKMCISFVKSTKSTNTSVTSGIASVVLNPGETSGFLNCGTGAVKFQFYKRAADGVVRVLIDDKPDTVSFTNLVVEGYYEPKDMTAVLTAEELTKGLAIELGPRRAQHSEVKRIHQYDCAH
jgi:hypothetical protein